MSAAEASEACPSCKGPVATWKDGDGKAVALECLDHVNCRAIVGLTPEVEKVLRKMEAEGLAGRSSS